MPPRLNLSLISHRPVLCASPSFFHTTQHRPNLSTFLTLSSHCTHGLGSRRLTVLALESSADDSCAAIISSNDDSPLSSSSSSSSSSSPSGDTSASTLASSAFSRGGTIHANIVIKQHHLHGVYGGIHPIVAHEGHLSSLPLAISRAFSESNLNLTDIDAIAYTRGPGMFGPLSVCSSSAKAIAAVTGKPLIGVHHMQAHALTVGLTDPNPPKFPFLTLLVSGGHTMLVLVQSFDKFRILATTIDTCIGGAFDKFARNLHLPPLPDRGLGPSIEHHASLPSLPPYDTNPLPALPFPLAKNHTKNAIAFSFSGLLAAAERLMYSQNTGNNSRLKNEVNEDEEKTYGKYQFTKGAQRELSRVFQEAAVGHVVQKVGSCITQLDKIVKNDKAENVEESRKQEKAVTGLVVSGGVGSNLYLRDQLRKMLDKVAPEIQLYFPPIHLCTDNAAMIGWTAILRMKAGLIGETPDLRIKKKWSLEELYNDVPKTCYRF